MIVVTRCVSVKNEAEYSVYKFHFKGFFKGHKIKEVKIEGSHELFKKKEEYLLALEVIEIREETLVGSLLKFKRF